MKVVESSWVLVAGEAIHNTLADSTLHSVHQSLRIRLGELFFEDTQKFAERNRDSLKPRPFRRHRREPWTLGQDMIFFFEMDKIEATWRPRGSRT